MAEIWLVIHFLLRRQHFCGTSHFLPICPPLCLFLFFFLSSLLEHSNAPRHVQLTFWKRKLTLHMLKDSGCTSRENKFNLHSKRTTRFWTRDELIDFTNTFFIFKMAHWFYGKHLNLILLTFVLIRPAESQRCQKFLTLWTRKVYSKHCHHLQWQGV